MTSLLDIENEFIRLEKIRKNGNWFDPRNQENYILRKRDYDFGERNYFDLDAEDYHFYKDLQASRGIPDIVDKSVTDYLSDFENSAYDMNGEDHQRNEELLGLLDIDGITNFVELGFRTPSVLNYWSERGLCVKGYDVVKVNVLVSSYLGWDVEEYDLSLCDRSLIFEDNTLVVSYHCFEHLIDPLNALRRVYSDMKHGSYFHIEVPVEDQSIPNLKYGHMQTFHSGDLQNMIDIVGFNVVNKTQRNDVDRFLVKK